MTCYGILLLYGACLINCIHVYTVKIHYVYTMLTSCIQNNEDIMYIMYVYHRAANIRILVYSKDNIT